MKIKTGMLLFMMIFWLFPAATNPQERFTEELLKAFTFRSLGPYRCGSWITDFEVPETPAKAHLYTFYVGTRNGGVWKTTNNGTTFEPIFDAQPMLSIGDIALAPSNPDIVWVGAGESYNARSSHRGDGIYKSKDSGQTWENMGLRDTHHIARIIIHPQNPDTVYVAAMGHLFTPNEERGVFRTTDGGKIWEKVLFINDRVGIIDLVMNRTNPDILYAAAYDKERLPWHFEEGGPGSAIYRTADAGKTWTRLSGGLPGGKIGRIGLDIYQPNPDILYAIVENANKRPPSEEEAAQDRKRGLEPQERTIGGEVYRTGDGGQTWKKMNSEKAGLATKAPYSFNHIRVDQDNDQKLFVTGVTLASSTDAGKTWHDADWPPRRLFQNAFGDVRTIWIDPENSNRIFFGSDGGVHISYDGGQTCDFLYNIPLGEFYAIGVDMEDPYNIYGGLQDHDSWKGPSNGWSGQVTLADWFTVGIQDGMYNQVDPNDSRWVYNTYQFGGHNRIDQRLGTITSIVPRREKKEEPYRFNWTPPLHISPHNSAIIYTGAQVLLRSLDRGDHWQEISPDLTTNDRKKIAACGPSITYCTITTISESPVKPGVIWVGTDDGKVQVTLNGGGTWKDLTAKIASIGGPENFWVSRVFTSHQSAGTAYVSKTGLRQDDFRPFLFKTTDYGESWVSLTGNLPEKPVNVVFEDCKNPNLLFVGTEQGVYVSINGGGKWLPLKNNMPWVKVTDLLVHPRENDLVVGTYGRGLYITDISPLQEMDEKMLDEDVRFFAIEPKSQRVTSGWGNYQLYGDRHLVTPNEPEAIAINYYLREKTKEDAKITVTDPYGELLAELKGKGDAGINRLYWNMQRQPKNGESGQPRWGARLLVEPGEYLVTLEVSGTKLTQKALITGRTGWTLGPRPTVIK